jgi:hypothetical protein
MSRTPAWTRKEGKNPKGGLNARGRASYKGGTLRPPVKSGDNPRRASFLARGQADEITSKPKSVGRKQQSRRKGKGKSNQQTE